MTIRRTANLLGALVVGLGDRLKKGTCGQLGQTGETPAALATLGQEPGLSVDALSRILGLSHSGGVRLVDRLALDGLVERRRGQNGRTLALYLTEEGARRRRDLIECRSKPLEDTLRVLSERDLKRLESILDKILYRLCQSELEAYSVCRLCDDAACGDCPVDRACDCRGLASDLVVLA